MGEIIVKKWEDVVNTGIVNPYSKCSCCDIKDPISYIQIGQSVHPAASFQLCGDCMLKLTSLLAK